MELTAKWGGEGVGERKVSLMSGTKGYRRRVLDAFLLPWAAALSRAFFPPHQKGL